MGFFSTSWERLKSELVSELELELELQVWPGTESGAELLRKDTSSAALVLT